MKGIAALIWVSLLTYTLTIAQNTGPGGVGIADGTSTLQGWWRADKGVTSSAGSVSAWADNSGYNHNLSQASGTNQPTVTTNATLNGQTVIKYSLAGSQFFTSSFSGPNTTSLTMFLVANGPGYESLLRFQNSGGNFVVYPWNFGPPTPNNLFISSTEGGTGGGIASGLVASVNNIGGARIAGGATNGMQTWLNGGLLNQKNSAGGTLPNETFWSGKYSGGSEFANCDVGEMIIYYSALNDAQMIIVQNYLSAKFNSALTSNDVYTMDNAGNGNYDFDVAGIGRVNSTNIHSDAQGTGFVRILNPTDLGDNEYFMWGQDNGAAQATNTADIPSGVTARFARTWRVSEVGEVGNIDIQFDVTGLPDFAGVSTCDAATSIRLLVDTNNDGLFSDSTPINGATNIGGNIYRFANVTPVNTGNRFTIAIVSTAVTGPGGVGGTNGTSTLALWLKANTVAQADGSNLSLWGDQSGYGNHANAVGGNEPVFRTSVAGTFNNQPLVRFTAVNTDYLRVNNAASLRPNTISMLLVGRYTALSSSNSPWLIKTTNNTLPDGYGILRSAATTTMRTYVTTTANLASGVLAANTTNIFASVYDKTDLRLWYNETQQGGAAAFTANITNSNNFLYVGIGPDAAGTGVASPFDGDIAEAIIFNTNITSTQRGIIENYLAAKYNLTLAAAADAYTDDGAGFDFEMAGIAQITATDRVTDAQGSGIMRINNASDLQNNEAFLWGHNGLSLTSTTTDVPAGVQAKFNRIWAVSEVGNVGTLDVTVDLSSQSPVTAADLRLVIDHDNDGIFNEAGTFVISGALALSCSRYLFAAVPDASLNSNSRFTIGTANKIQTPLPIELLSFYGTTGTNGVELHWTTATEINSDYFSVERSLNGEKFSEVLKVRAAGNSTEQKTYSVPDPSAPAGKIYYRLKSFDYNGEYSYSKIIAIDNPFAESKIMVSPNPVRIGSDLEIRFLNFGELDGGEIIVGLFDMLGRQVQVPFEKKGDNFYAVKTGATPAAGFYILKIKSSGWTREYVQRVYISE